MAMGWDDDAAVGWHSSPLATFQQSKPGNVRPRTYAHRADSVQANTTELSSLALASLSWLEQSPEWVVGEWIMATVPMADRPFGGQFEDPELGESLWPNGEPSSRPATPDNSYTRPMRQRDNGRPLARVQQIDRPSPAPPVVAPVVPRGNDSAPVSADMTSGYPSDGPLHEIRHRRSMRRNGPDQLPSPSSLQLGDVFAPVAGPSKVPEQWPTLGGAQTTPRPSKPQPAPAPVARPPPPARAPSPPAPLGWPTGLVAQTITPAPPDHVALGWDTRPSRGTAPARPMPAPRATAPVQQPRSRPASPPRGPAAPAMSRPPPAPAPFQHPEMLSWSTAPAPAPVLPPPTLPDAPLVASPPRTQWHCPPPMCEAPVPLPAPTPSRVEAVHSTGARQPVSDEVPENWNTIPAASLSSLSGSTASVRTPITPHQSALAMPRVADGPADAWTQTAMPACDGPLAQTALPSEAGRLGRQPGSEPRRDRFGNALLGTAATQTISSSPLSEADKRHRAARLGAQPTKRQLFNHHAFTGPALPKTGINDVPWKASTDTERAQLKGWPLYRDSNGNPVDRFIYKGSYSPDDWDTRPKQGRRP